MSDPVKPTTPEPYLLPWVASILLALLACGWALAFLFSESEPSLVAAIIGVPTFLATPVVSLAFFLLLRTRRGLSAFHRAMFYCSACFFAAWSVFAVAGFLTR